MNENEKNILMKKNETKNVIKLFNILTLLLYALCALMYFICNSEFGILFALLVTPCTIIVNVSLRKDRKNLDNFSKHSFAFLTKQFFSVLYDKNIDSTFFKHCSPEELEKIRNLQIRPGDIALILDNKNKYLANDVIYIAPLYNDEDMVNIFTDLFYSHFPQKQDDENESLKKLCNNVALDLAAETMKRIKKLEN